MKIQENKQKRESKRQQVSEARVEERPEWNQRDERKVTKQLQQPSAAVPAIIARSAQHRR